LGHPVRLAILRFVVQAGADGATTTDIQAKLDIPWTTLNHHLTRLVNAGLVNAAREGKFAIHTAAYAALKVLTNFPLGRLLQRRHALEELLWLTLHAVRSPRHSAVFLPAEKLPLQGLDEHFASFLVAEVESRVVAVAGLELHGD
jgi:ArsR family transcriptional regulator